MPAPFTTQRRVEFRDTDAAGIIHFSTYFAFMEESEHELLRSLGLSVVLHRDDKKLSFPRVAARCDFQRTVKFEDIVDIEVRIDRVGKKSVTYGFLFRHDGLEIASGAMTSVCCCVDGTPEPIPIPPDVAGRLREFQARCAESDSDMHESTD